MISAKIRRSLFLAIVILTNLIGNLDAKQSSLKPELIEKFRNNFFKVDTPSCITFARNMRTIPSNDLDLKDKIAKIISAIKRQNLAEITSYFHPRLQMSKNQVVALLDSMRSAYGAEFDVSLYRVWAFNTVDGSAKPLACVEDELSVAPHYGYNLQFGIWLQVSGDSNVGRIYLSLVPSDQWYVGVWHSQQWSYQNKDPDAWLSEALADKAKQQIMQAYFKLDLVAHLYEGAGYIYIQKRQDVVATRDQLLSPENKIAKYVKLVGDARIVNVGTVFAKDGPGYMLRLKVAKAATAIELRNECFKLLAKVYKNDVLVSPEFGSSRCSFVVDGESIDKDGAKGSVLLTKNQIQNGK